MTKLLLSFAGADAVTFGRLLILIRKVVDIGPCPLGTQIMEIGFPSFVQTIVYSYLIRVPETDRVA